MALRWCPSCRASAAGPAFLQGRNRHAVVPVPAVRLPLKEKYDTVYRRKIFTQEQVQELFLSVGWVSGQYPQRLYKALMHSSTVLTAWDGDRLVGLISALDDSEMLAQITMCWSPGLPGAGHCRTAGGAHQGKVQELPLH